MRRQTADVLRILWDITKTSLWIDQYTNRAQFEWL
jgi:hypothetical protein